MKVFWKKGKRRILYSQLYELLERYFEGTASNHEQKIIESWIPEEDRKNNSWYSEEMLEKDRVQIYKKLSLQFNFRTQETTEQPEASKYRITPRSWTRLAAAASIALIVIFTGWLFFRENRQMQMNEKELVATMIGQDKKEELHLEDGSFVQMNKGSNLYLVQSEFNKKKRELWMDGEAFFDVARDPSKAFSVHSGNMKIVVHGTSFIIKAYQEIDEYIVSVRTGKVEVIVNDHSLTTLTPNKQLVYHQKNKEYEINEINWEDAAAWMNGVLSFNNASREELKLRIQQNYGVLLNYSENVLKDVKLNARFPMEASLQDVLKNIGQLYNIDFSIKGKEVTLYNSN